MKTLLFLMRDHTLGFPRVPPYHGPVAKSVNYHHMRTLRKESQQGAALPLISSQSLLGRMHNSYNSHIDTPSLDYYFVVVLPPIHPTLVCLCPETFRLLVS
jgi:hypothetical protein